MGEYVNPAKIFGENVFNDTVMQERLPKNVYKKLKKIIDDSLKTLIENGTLKELSEKYLDGDYAPQL